MVKLKHFLVFSALVLFNGVGLNSVAQDSNSSFTKVHRLLLQMELPKARNLLEQTKYSNTHHPYYDSYASFLEVVLGQRQNATDTVYQSISENISFLKSQAPKDALIHYYQADMYLMLCVLSIQKQELVKAFSNYWSFYKQQKSNVKKFPDFVLNQKHQFIAVVFQFWINSWFLNDTVDEQNFWEENYPTSLKNLLVKTEAQPLIQQELFIIDALLQTNFNTYSKNALPCCLNGIETADASPIALYARALCNNKSYQHVSGLKNLQLADSLGFNQRIPMLDLMLGVALLNQLDADAVHFLERFVNNPTIGNQIAYGKLKLAWYYFIFDDKDKAQALVAEIPASEKKPSPQDKQAVYEATHAANWKAELLKSRLLFDGGDYSESAAILLQSKNQVANYKREQKLEYSYRLARAYHQLNDYKKAVLFYEMTIDTDFAAEYYYPCYAAFYLGEIYQLTNRNDLAAKYFHLCLKLDAPIYQSEIHKRAQMELRKLE
ncbi:MAG: tol-pal system YbgF family protein [Salinivirgaceae bacterium]